jgi:ribokinase
LEPSNINKEEDLLTNKFDVICIGAALVDMIAKVSRYPEDDDEVFVSDLKLQSGGAAANTAAACSTLGLDTAFIGKLGEADQFGKKILQDFKDVSVSTDFLKYSKDHTTGSAYVALNQNDKNRRIFAHSGAANYLSGEDILEKEIKTAKSIYLSSLKNIEPFLRSADIAQNEDIPVILNPGMLIIDQGFDTVKKLLQTIDIFILSDREFKTLMGVERKQLSETEYIKSAKQLQALTIDVIIVTLGKRGALLITDKDSIIIPPIGKEEVVDTTGAGDAFSAGFIYGFLHHLSYNFEKLATSVKLGNFVAGKCIQQLGARNGIPSEPEIKSFQHTIKNDKI